MQGVNFLNDGVIWKFRGVAGFNGFQRWLNGERGQLDDFAGWARGLGANAWACFCMWAVTNFDPRTYGSRYYDEFPTFQDWLRSNGFRPFPVLFCDQENGSAIQMSQAEQDHHFQQLAPHLEVVEYVNEDFKNGTIAHRFPSGGWLASRSAFEDAAPYTEPGSLLDFSTVGFVRKDDWPREGKNLWDITRGDPGLGQPPTRKPAIAREPPAGIWEQDKDFSRSADPHKFADFHALCELMGSGSFIHGDFSNVQTCVRPGPNADACARAIAAVWSAGLPADAHANGNYTRGGLGDCPIAHIDLPDPRGALRTFALLRGNQATAIVVQPGPQWQLQPVNGWRVTRQYGPHGQLVDLQR